jgi:methylglutaconyl-CoA hydratase
MEQGPLVRAVADGPVTTLTLDSPANRNALSLGLLGELSSHLDALAAAPPRAVVVTGTGPAFSSGADLKAGTAAVAATPPAVAEVLDKLWALPSPVVVALNGHVRAGGLGIVAAADVVVAPATATFAFAEVRIGVVPAVVAVVCARRMAPRALSRYTLTGEPFTAAEARDAGLVTIVVEPDEVAATTASLVEELTTAGPRAVAATKSLLRTLAPPIGPGMAEAAALSAEVFASPEATEGIAAFAARRTPAWRS